MVMAHRRPARTPRPRTPTIQRHMQAHAAVIHEAWYGDGPPSFGKAFTAAETAKRNTLVIGILYRAAKKAAKAKDTKLHDAYGDLADKLYACKPKARCGSLACPKCARAFQKAKVSAQQTVITDLAADRSDKSLVFVSVVPKGMTYKPSKFSNIDIAKANRWLKDALKPVGTNRPIMGSADLGWETRRGGQYIQLHWHLALWTNDPDQLEAKLKEIFRRTQKHERPVDVRHTRDRPKTHLGGLFVLRNQQGKCGRRSCRHDKSKEYRRCRFDQCLEADDSDRAYRRYAQLELVLPGLAAECQSGLQCIPWRTVALSL